MNSSTKVLAFFCAGTLSSVICVSILDFHPTAAVLGAFTGSGLVFLLFGRRL